MHLLALWSVFISPSVFICVHAFAHWRPLEVSQALDFHSSWSGSMPTVHTDCSVQPVSSNWRKRKALNPSAWWLWSPRLTFIDTDVIQPKPLPLHTAQWDEHGLEQNSQCCVATGQTYLIFLMHLHILGDNTTFIQKRIFCIPVDRWRQQVHTSTHLLTHLLLFFPTNLS